MRAVGGGGRRWAAAVVGLSLLTGLAVVRQVVNEARPAGAETGATTSLESRSGGTGVGTTQDQVGTPVYPSMQPSISADGRVIAFTEDAEFPGSQRLIIRDRSIQPAADQVDWVDWDSATSTDSTIEIGNGDGLAAWAPAVSADGCFVAFLTNESFDENDIGGVDVYRLQLPWNGCGGPAMDLVSYANFFPGGLFARAYPVVNGSTGSPVEINGLNPQLSFGWAFDPNFANQRTLQIEIYTQGSDEAVEITSLFTVFNSQFTIGAPVSPSQPACQVGTVLVGDGSSRTSCFFTITANPGGNAQVTGRLIVEGTDGATIGTVFPTPGTPHVPLSVNRAAQIQFTPTIGIVDGEGGNPDTFVTVSAAAPPAGQPPAKALITAVTPVVGAEQDNFGVDNTIANACLPASGIGVVLTPGSNTCVVNGSFGCPTSTSGSISVATATAGFGTSIPVSHLCITNTIAVTDAAMRPPLELGAIPNQFVPDLPAALGGFDSDAFNNTDHLSISADGHLVAYSADSPLINANPNGAETVYLVDMTVPPTDEGFVTAVPGPSVPPPSSFDIASSWPSLSADGSIVAFHSDRALPGTEPPTGGTGWSSGVQDVWIWNRSTDAVSPLLGVNGELPNSGDVEFQEGAGFPDLSDDGTRVAFQSTAKNLDATIPPDNYSLPFEGDFQQVFVADFTDPAAPVSQLITRVPTELSPPITSGFGDSTRPVISGDGQNVAYETEANNIPDVPTFTYQVMLSPYPTAPNGTYVRISEGVSADNPVCRSFTTFRCNREPAIDATGRNIAWASNGDPLEVIPFDPTTTFPPDSPFYEFNVYNRYRPPNVVLDLSNIDFGLVPVGSTASVVVTASNQGLTPFVIAEIGAGGPFNAVPGPGTGCAPGTTIPASASCTILVTFTPLDTSFAEGSYGISEDPSSFQFQFAAGNVEGQGTDSPLVIQPTPDDFGNTNIGTTAPPRTYTVTNTSDVPIQITGVTLGGTVPGDFALSNDTCTGVTLQPGATCTYTLTFTPSGEGVRPADAIVTGVVASDPNSTSITATGSVSGTGVAVFSLQITPAPFNFGLVRVGTQSTARVFTITNFGNVPNTVSPGVLGGPNANQFVITTNGCNTTLAPNASCTVAAAFRPTVAGTQNATLTVTGQNGSAASSDLTGRGGAVALAFAPATLSYGITAVGLAAPNQATVLRNTGDLSVQLGAITIAGPNASDYSIAANTCTTGLTLPAGGSCTVTIRFAPTGGGTRTATLTATGNPTVATSAALTGTGNGQFLLSITPSPATFNQITVNQASTPTTLTIRNPGATPNTINSVLLSGPDATQFTITTNTCTTGLTLAPGATCTVEVTFTPTTAGTLVAALVAIGTGGSSATATLTGQSLFAPTITLNTDVARPGQVITATGTGFPPNTPIQLFFQDAPNQLITTITQPDGTFTIPIVLTQGQPTGPRTILVIPIPNQFNAPTPTPVLVTLATVDPQDSISPAFLLGNLKWLQRG